MSRAITQLILVWAILLALLAATLAATFLPPSSVRTAIAYGIASLKAVLILWYFMDLRREDALARFAALAGMIWILILLVLTGADYFSR